MPDQPKKFYLTTPIYYVNARPHIGHAYTTIVADVLARRHRLLGDDTFFLTGTDEHGQKIERSAAAAGVPPLQFADQVSASFAGLWQRMGITNDAFIRTTDPRHIQGAQKLFAELYARGQIYLSSYTGQYSIGEEMFVEGPPGTIGPDGRPTETVTEENFFFRLSAYQQPLLELIESNQLVITPDSSRNEVLSFIRSGLRDLSVSRSSFTWGIPVPDDILRDAGTTQKHVIYVWLDALANYMTAIGYGSPAPAEQEKFEHFWPTDLHLVGKEITRFHCVYWPAFLLAAGLPLPKQITAHGWLLFDNSKMSKSKGNIVRTETILDAFGDHVYGKQFPDSTKAERDLFASDVLRYFLLREIPFGQDGSFSFDALITRYNADLANGYGNLVSRTLTLTQSSFPHGFSRIYMPQFSSFLAKVEGGAIAPGEQTWWVGEDPEPEVTNPENSRRVDHVVGRLLSSNDFSTALRELAALVSHVDVHMTLHKPWKLAKAEEPGARASLESALYIAAEAIRIITALLYPILPFATARVWSQLGLGDIELAAKNGELNNLQWGGLEPGTTLGPLAPIFPRADKGLADIMIQMEEKQLATGSSKLEAGSQIPSPTGPLEAHSAKLAAESQTPQAASPTAAATGPTAAAGPAPLPTPLSPIPSQITIDDFAKVELRVAQILVAERIPKADKLLRLEVDLGDEKRQILSGIAEWYTPEELIGRRIVVIANLAPRKMRGLESHGMLLAASADEDGKPGKPILATMAEDIALGSRLK